MASCLVNSTGRCPTGWACQMRSRMECPCCIAVMFSSNTQWVMTMPLHRGMWNTFHACDITDWNKLWGNVVCQNKRKCFYLEMEVGKRRKLPLWTKNSSQLFQIYQWMTQIQKNNSELVTQHFLGKTFENRTMYYLQVREELSLNNKTYLNKKKSTQEKTGFRCFLR